MHRYVVVLPDSGIKYLTKIYSPEWRQSKGFEAKTGEGGKGAGEEGGERKSADASTMTEDPQRAANVVRVSSALQLSGSKSTDQLEDVADK